MKTPSATAVAVVDDQKDDSASGTVPVQRTVGEPVGVDQAGAESRTGTQTTNSDDYADVLVLFAQLRSLTAESHEYARVRDRIIARCLKLAENVARHFDRRGENLDDLIQVARLGLVKAVDRFDHEKGSSFLSFAVPTMMGEVRRHFRDHAWSVHVPRRLRDRHSELTRMRTELTHTLGRAPTVSELAEAMGVDREELIESLLAADAYQAGSLDAPMRDGESNPRAVADTLGAIDDRIDGITDRETVRPLLAALPERERTVLYLRFFESMSQSQIGERIGVSQMHVSRILDRTLRELREGLTAG